MHIERTAFTDYQTMNLHGSSAALHFITVEGNQYRFAAPSRNRWAYKGDLLTFDWKMDDGFRRIDTDTLQVFDNRGAVVVRGLRFTDLTRLRNVR